MNIIDAWKAAKDGQKLQRPNGAFVYKSIFFIDSILGAAVSDPSILAEDWEVVKDKKKETFFQVTNMRFDDRDGQIRRAFHAHENATVTIEWEE